MSRMLDPRQPQDHLLPMPPNAQTPDLSRSARLASARRKVAALKGLYIHAAVFAVVIVGLVVVDLVAGPPAFAHWVALGWGIGVAAHAVAVYVGVSEAVHRWERRKIDQFMKVDEKSGGPS